MSDFGYILVKKSNEQVRYDKCECGLFEDVETRMKGPEPQLFVKYKRPDGTYGAYNFQDGTTVYFGNYEIVRPVEVLGVYPSGKMCCFDYAPYGLFLYDGEFFIKSKGETRISSAAPFYRTRSFKIGESTAFASGIMVEPLEMRKVIEVLPEFADAVAQNDGYCPCLIEQNEDTLCPCREFREQTVSGLCHCGRYEKIKEDAEPENKTPSYPQHYSVDKDFDETCGLLEEG